MLVLAGGSVQGLLCSDWTSQQDLLADSAVIALDRLSHSSKPDSCGEVYESSTALGFNLNPDVALCASASAFNLRRGPGPESTHTRPLDHCMTVILSPEVCLAVSTTSGSILFRCPCNESPTTFGSILGDCFFGNSHLLLN